MDFNEGADDSLARELDSLRKQIEDLPDLRLRPEARVSDSSRTPADLNPVANRIRFEIESHFGYLPPYFLPALNLPEILAALWQGMRTAYLKSSIPELTREKLFARLARTCPVSYAVVAHCCALRQLEMPAAEILRWLERPAPGREEDLESLFSLAASMPRPLRAWPEPGSPLEEGLVQGTICLYLHSAAAERCRHEIQQLLGPSRYGQLILFLSYMKLHFAWLEAYPEPLRDQDRTIRSFLPVILEEEPRLAPLFSNYFETPSAPAPVSGPSGAEDREETLLPHILDHGPYGVAVLDPDYRILEANEALCRLLGFLEHELEALTLPAVIHPQDVGSCIHVIDQVFSGARPSARVEKRFLKRNKEIVWVELTAAAIRHDAGSALFSLAFFEEVTERKRAEEMLRSDRQLLDRLLQDNRDGVFVFNHDLVCTLWNPAMERIFGIREGDAVGRIVFELFPSLSENGEDKPLLESLRGESVTVQNRPFRAAATGSEGFYDAFYTPLLNEERKVSGGIGFVRDITERRRADESRRATEERYRELFENANDIVYTHDLEGRITSINKAAERITGYTRAEALQMKAGDLVVPRQLKIACKMIERQVAGESPAPYELEIRAKDGRTVALEISTHTIQRGGKPVGVQGIARDITERKKTEEALQQAKQNLEAWVHELEERTREMTLLSEMGDMLRACLSTEEAYNVIVRVAQQIFPVQVGALYVISPSRHLVEAVALWGDSSQVERVFAPDECWALRRGRVHWVEDAAVGLLCKHLHQPPPESYLCVPMMAQSEALGILYLAQPAAARLTESKQRLAVNMAEHIAMALSNLKLHETLRSQSIRDPLTGLFNRRFMEESLELELRRAARSRRPLGVIMLEVDDFESRCRALGDNAQDSILVELGALLRTIIRKEDIACRYGEGKFTVLLPQGSLEITAQRAAILREMIGDLEIRHRGRSLGRVTISAGIAGFPDQGRTGETLIRAADAALQRARQEGGNRIVNAQ